MGQKTTDIKQNSSNIEEDKFTDEKRLKYSDITDKITSQIQTALILHKLKTWNNWDPDVAELSYDQNWMIKESKAKDAEKKWPIDIQWHNERINIPNIVNNLYQIINDSNIVDERDKKHLKDGINDFIKKQFLLPRINLESKERLPHKAFRKRYSKLAKEQTDLDTEWQKLYKDICLTLANLLFEKDNVHLKEWSKKHQKKEDKPPLYYNFVNQQWEITQKWLQYIWYIFLTAINNIPNSWDPKPFHKIFHDGDFNFLGEQDSAGNPIIGTLDQYIRAIMYLMTDWFNAYAEWWEAWDRERYIARKGFLNQLYNTSQLKIDYNNKHIETSDQWIIHDKLSKAWMDDSEIATGSEWRLTTRKKTNSSILLKIWSRTNDINDESWVRATYYWDMQDKEWIKRYILYKIKDYFNNKVSKINWVYIQNITYEKKGDFISSEDEDNIVKELADYIWFTYESKKPKISPREKHWKKKSKLWYVCSKYKTLTKEKATPGLQKAYNIANWEILRWANWNYTDFKLCIEYAYKAYEYNKGSDPHENHVQQDGILHQEVSFYNDDNDLNMWNHDILNLEKRIFDQVKNVDAYDVWKTISLDKLRRFTETAIKTISQKIEKRTEKIELWLEPKPKNDDYKYLCIDDQKVSLEWLVYRNQKNTDRFDTLILMILNYFLTHNKIFYILPPNKWLEYSDDQLKKLKDGFISDWNFYTANEIEKELDRRESLRRKWQIDKDDTGISEQQVWLITKEQLHDKKAFRGRRFTTSDQLKKSAKNPDNTNHCIAFYTTNDTRIYDNFYVINLWKLKKFIELEKKH